jgi:hypothetical protein
MNDENRAKPALHETSERCLTGGRQQPPMADTANECLYCGNPLPEYGQWCDTECRNNWKQSRAQRK